MQPMTDAHSATPAPKAHSVSRVFSYAFIGIVTLILIAFAAVGIVFNIILIEGELEQCHEARPHQSAGAPEASGKRYCI
jgi:hypothetical protein